MEVNVYTRDMEFIGLIDNINTLLWTRRYWSPGEFSLLVPFSELHAELLQKRNIIMKRDGSTEAAEITYVNIRENTDGEEEIEVQGKFLSNWIAKRIVLKQISATDNTQNILYRIVRENVISPSNTRRKIAVLQFDPGDEDCKSGRFEYVSEAYINALLACTDAAQHAKLGFRVITDVRKRLHYFSVYAGRNLTADQNELPPCVFSKEFDNVLAQEFTDSIENYMTTCYVGGEEVEPRVVEEVGASAAGLDRDEMFSNATDITWQYEDDNGNEKTRTAAEFKAALQARGASDLDMHGENIYFSSKINAHSNLVYGEDFELGDRVTCINKRWRVKINVRITEIMETYKLDGDEIDVTFGESLPVLLDQIRSITKSG